MDSSCDFDTTSEFTATRHSSKLSLGSSPSVLSGDEEEEEETSDKVGDGSCGIKTAADDTTKQVVFDEGTEELDDQDSASPLSSVPDDFPLSRSASPEIQDNDGNPLLLLSSITSSLVADWAKDIQGKADESNTVEPGESMTETEPSKDTIGLVEADTTPSYHANEEKENTPIASINQPLEEPTHQEDWDSQQRHKDALEALTHIEIEFARLREKIYQEKMAKLNEEAVMIANGTHPELVTLMAEIEEKKGRRIRTAQAWRKHQHGNFRRQFEGFEYQANVHFISRKSAIRRELLSSTHGKRWRLEDEQGKLNDPMQRSIPDAHTLGAQKQMKRIKTMDLQDIKDVIGFPRAPQVPGLSQQDIQDDLLVLGLGASTNH